MSGPYRHGSFRRRIRVVVDTPGVVAGGLEDDFHYFQVRVNHDGEQVTTVEAESKRWPWSTCPGAAVPLQALAGMPLSRRCLAVGDDAGVTSRNLGEQALGREPLASHTVAPHDLFCVYVRSDPAR